MQVRLPDGQVRRAGGAGAVGAGSRPPAEADARAKLLREDSAGQFRAARDGPEGGRSKGPEGGRSRHPLADELDDEVPESGRSRYPPAVGLREGIRARGPPVEGVPAGMPPRVEPRGALRSEVHAPARAAAGAGQRFGRVPIDARLGWGTERGESGRPVSGGPVVAGAWEGAPLQGGRLMGRLGYGSRGADDDAGDRGGNGYGRAAAAGRRIGESSVASEVPGGRLADRLAFPAGRPGSMPYPPGGPQRGRTGPGADARTAHEPWCACQPF